MATELGKAYVQIVPSAKGIKGSIESVLGNEAESAGKSAGGKISGAIGGVLGGVGTAMKVGFGAAIAGVTAASGAVAAFGKSAVESYASYEQLVGGVDKLYGDASGKLQQYADDAFKTAGMSANDYMETATSFSASLINSLGGDVDKAADLTDMAMRAMSDNVNVFGSDMESVSNAYMGLAKGNATMLDNLKLGYGGNRSELERLIADANTYRESIGETANLSADSFADIVQAIQSVQEAQNIAGTTGKEAMTTIEGSATAVKAAWENVITAVGRGEGLSEAFDGLVSAFFGESEGEGLLNQIIPRIQTTMEGISTFITTAAPYIAEALPALVNAVVPSLLSTAMTLLSTFGQALMDNIGPILFAAGDIIEMLMQGLLDATNGQESIIMEILDWIIGVFNENYSQLIDVGAQIILNVLNGIINSMPQLLSSASEFITTFGQMLIDNGPALIEAAFSLISILATGIADALPTLIPMAVELLTALTLGLVENIDILVQGAIDLMMGLTDGIIAALPVLIAALPEVVMAICTALLDNLPLLLNATVQIVVALVQAIFENLPMLIEATLECIVLLAAALAEANGQILDAVIALLVGVWNQIVKYGGDFLKKAGEVCKNILDAVVKFLSELPTKMAYYAGYAIGQFIKFFLELPGKIKEVWNNVITGVKGFIEDFKNKATDGGKGFFKNIIDGIKELPTKVIEIGGNIVKGIWKGISDGWTWLTDSIKGLADSLLGGVKDALGIESPSKEFAWVGKMVDEGFAEGIVKNANLVDAALASLTPSVQGGSVYATLSDQGSGFRGNATINVYPSAGMNERELAEDINYYLANQNNRRKAIWGPVYA